MKKNQAYSVIKIPDTTVISVMVHLQRQRKPGTVTHNFNPSILTEADRMCLQTQMNKMNENVIFKSLRFVSMNVLPEQLYVYCVHA